MAGGVLDPKMSEQLFLDEISEGGTRAPGSDQGALKGSRKECHNRKGCGNSHAVEWNNNSNSIEVDNEHQCTANGNETISPLEANNSLRKHRQRGLKIPEGLHAERCWQVGSQCCSC